MASRKPGICIHCLRSTKATEADHVFPRSWYPDSTPQIVQRWTAPSCQRCNRKFGQLEKDLLIRLIGCIDPKSPAISGLYEKAHRSLGVGADAPESERAIREKLRERLRSELQRRPRAFEPNLTISGLDGADGDWQIPIPYAALSIMAEKIARGCEYRYRGRRRLIHAPYGVRTLIRETDFIPEPFGSACVLLDFGPGCKIRRLRFFEDSLTVWYFITIWGTLNLHVRIELERQLLVAEKEFRRTGGVKLAGDSAMQLSDYLRTFDQDLPETNLDGAEVVG